MALEKITQVSGRGVYVPGNDIDTDRIIPARFMKCVSFDGLGEFLFYDVRKDADGIFFVDYLHAFLTELDEPEFQPDVLRSHKRLILNGLGNSHGLSTVPAKYLWLANYHNGLVRRLSKKWYGHYGLTLADLEVSAKEMPINFEWPSNQ